jgi:hypothetical protein
LNINNEQTTKDPEEGAMYQSLVGKNALSSPGETYHRQHPSYKHHHHYLSNTYLMKSREGTAAEVNKGCTKNNKNNFNNVAS